MPHGHAFPIMKRTVSRTISLKARIGLTIGFLAVLLLAVGLMGLSGLNRAYHAYRGTAGDQMPSVVDVNNAEIYAGRARLAMDRAAFMIGTPQAKPTIARARMLYGVSEQAWNRYLARPRNAAEDQLAQTIKERRTVYEAALDDFAKTIEANDPGSVIQQANRLQVSYSALSKTDDALSKTLADEATQGMEETRATYDLSRTLTIAVLCIGMAAALVSYITLRHSIARPLAKALEHFAAIAAGDLRHSVNVHSLDEMGQVLQGIDRMQQSLTGMVHAVRSGSDSIATATREIAAGNLDLSSRTEEQASALQQTAANMDELTGTVKQNADNARQASQLAATASQIADRGNTVVKQVIGTMSDINQSSSKIADIISIIEGIAFQTNILALNAAVEAARAGEDGRGFAVVASEVRSLAQRSAAAAKDIKALVDSSVACVRSGSALVDEAGLTMNEIMGAVQRVTDIMGEIAAASEEQSRGIDQVARAVTQMDEVTQQNAALVEQAAAAAQSLESQASGLHRAVAKFSVEPA